MFMLFFSFILDAPHPSAHQASRRPFFLLCEKCKAGMVEIKGRWGVQQKE